MPRPKTKDELIQASNSNFQKLFELIDSMSQKSLNTKFDFSDQPKKKEAHWSRDKNLRDILIHLHEWHLLILKWIKENVQGNTVDFLPAPYNWKTYGEMNIKFWEKHQNTEYLDSVALVKETHKKVMAQLEQFSTEELFSKKYFKWTGTTSLGSYYVSTLSSHYDWAIKKIKAHIRKTS